MNRVHWTKRAGSLAGMVLAGVLAYAQPGRVTYLAPHIKTLTMAVDGDAEAFPVIQLNSHEKLHIAFDDMTHEYRRYTYRIEHCDAEGAVSDQLFESDYVSAMADEEVIEDYTTSVNTTVLYTHYSLSLPNAHVRPLLSGNYRLTVSTEDDEGENQTVAQCYFGVVDTQVGIRPSCTTDTDIDYHKSHQQLDLRVDCGNLILRDAESEIHTVVMQNRDYLNARRHVPFNSQNGQVLNWEHNRELIFEAGNEYRKMEFISTRYPGMHGDGVLWHDPFYHYTLMRDYPRTSYLYDEDRDGLYLTRCEGGGDATSESDYAITHFSIEMPRLPEGRHLYVDGRWTMPQADPAYEMAYDASQGIYTADILLKCGYYNYRYMTTTDEGLQPLSSIPAEGSFHQTENEYNILVYHLPAGGRYWQLIGCVNARYRP